VFAAKIDDLGGCLGNTARALAQQQHPVASSEALDVCYWAMRPALYHRIHLVIKIASNVGVFLCISNFVVIHNLRYRPCYGPYKLKLRQSIL
jgi:hypothetical protein